MIHVYLSTVTEEHVSPECKITLHSVEENTTTSSKFSEKSLNQNTCDQAISLWVEYLDLSLKKSSFIYYTIIQ